MTAFLILDSTGQPVDIATGHDAAQRRLDWLQRTTLKPHTLEPVRARVCVTCAAIGRFTWLNDDGSCRRKDKHQ